jgi:AraC-like DNA-binding protein
MEYVSAKALSGYIVSVESLGVDPTPIIESFGLKQSMLTNPQDRDVIALDKLLALVNSTADITGCGYFGALLGTNQDLSSLGDIGQLVKLSSSIESALQVLVRYLHLYWQNAAILHIEIIGETCFLHLENRSNKDMRHFVEATLVAVFRMLKLLSGGSFKIQGVQFCHSAPSDTRIYKKMFKVPVRFDQEKSLLVFPSRYLKVEIPSSDAALNSILRRYLENLDKSHSNDIVSRVNELIDRSLPSNQCSADAVAAILSMHRRSMHRMLKERGTSFRDLLEQHRRNRSEQLLKYSELRVTAIANNLGYADLSAFNHAFKKWYGIAPTGYRKQLKKTIQPDA